MKHPSYAIPPCNRSIETEIQNVIDKKTKPTGSLGYLENIAKQTALVQQTVSPELVKPHIIVFAGDHGLAEESVSAYPKAVTHQMVINFLNGGAAINTFTRQHGIALTIVDAGVDAHFGALAHPEFIASKIGNGTRNSLQEPAMSSDEFLKAMLAGANIVAKISDSGSNIIGFGEMGIGNTSAASLVMHLLTDIPISDCVGKGTGVSESGFEHKKNIIRSVTQKARTRLHGSKKPEDILMQVAGFEMAMMYGAMLQAAECGMLVMVDGFIATSVYLAAYTSAPAIRDYAIFSHCSDEAGHSKLLDYLQARPLLQLSMRLGEGTGCAVVYPIIQSAVAFMNEMASFKDAGVHIKS